MVLLPALVTVEGVIEWGAVTMSVLQERRDTYLRLRSPKDREAAPAKAEEGGGMV